MLPIIGRDLAGAAAWTSKKGRHGVTTLFVRFSAVWTLGRGRWSGRPSKRTGWRKPR